MKGPFERLRLNFKRTWECPVCHQRRQTTGRITSQSCNCRVLKKTGDIVWMQLIHDAPPARCPIAMNIPTNRTSPKIEETIDAAEAENEQS